MAKKPKRKLTTAEKAAKARRKAQFMTIFLNGRQKRVRRPGYVDGQDVAEFIRRNADPMWLHQNEMWELLADPEPDEACLAHPDDELFWA
jgi:hypothetical protein